MRSIVRVFVVVAVASSCSMAQAKLVGSKHDLSVRGGAKAARGGSVEICVFCHTPHTMRPVAPAWSKRQGSVLYTPYSSPTMQADVGQPTGTSKVCLSCHDGTIALTAVQSPSGESFGPYRLSERANLTSDLSDDHPISFTYDPALAARDPELVNPSSLPAEVWLDQNEQMQCTSCHDPHGSGYPYFLVIENTHSGLCIACHDKTGWAQSAHATSAVGWNGTGTDPWPYSDENTVAANACANCHTSHAAGIPESLLIFPREEENCLSCHDGNTAATDIASEIEKAFNHPVDRYLGIHVAVEEPDSMPRHVECHDCHNPHAAVGGETAAPDIARPNTAVPGVNAQGAPVATAHFEYEMCFRCHADGPDVPPPYIERQIVEPNIRLKVDTRNPSFHPIREAGRNVDVPSLLFPLTETSIIYCSDCHSGNSGTLGSGPRGPHGSVWPFLLEDQYSVEDGTSESFQAYAMCYQCHDREVILRDVSFSTHKKHIVDDATSCSACHDPHGISATEGNPTNNSHLINFDVSIVRPDAQGRLEFEDLGANRGRCYLDCHGKMHSPLEY
jgi:predicted CXXCH cytochrome family protein